MMQYSDRAKAEALAVLDAHGGNVYRTAQELGIPRTTLQEWAINNRVNDDVTALRQEKRVPLADLYERIAYKYLAEADKDEKASATGAKDAVITAATATDKMRLLREQSTQNIGVSVTDAALRWVVYCREQGFTGEEIAEAVGHVQAIDAATAELIRRVVMEPKQVRLADDDE